LEASEWKKKRLFWNCCGEQLNLVFEFGSDHIIWGISPRIPKEPKKRGAVVLLFRPFVT
jgi:hypothetical protein